MVPKLQIYLMGFIGEHNETYKIINNPTKALKNTFDFSTLYTKILHVIKFL